uniref:Ig-like domain-containing protein n=1 Tax=Athene cunicularia TaxID=194338 RepID=A0A663LK37_ATHCN
MHIFTVFVRTELPVCKVTYIFCFASKVVEGETVILNCHFNSPRPPSLPDLTVKWYKEDEKGQMDLLENNVTILPNNSRIFMSGDLSHGDASLVILNVTTSDHGIYFCEVTLPDGKARKPCLPSASSHSLSSTGYSCNFCPPAWVIAFLCS